ncbi:GNAT family N-acetyltransferase [Duncaniella freteri]|uniref:GNAT family N-acetyltransferase n=1 Tax=Duncaniella freteri TaxID=2530391 RepID=UPI00136B1328|nr:GNAT family N-acetyltransferase [Duncaniella freteri]NBJ08719.1 N-acetyltransferase [Alistipes sp. Z76]NCE70715.1 N-acetyltransferase [Muribaculaceae bacterium M3]
MIDFRALEPIDVDTLYRWENDPAVWGVGSTMAPYSRKQLWDYVDSYDGDIFTARQLRLMITIPSGKDGEVKETVGTVDLYDFDPVNSRCAVGILIAPEYRRRGYAYDALIRVADYCHKRLSLHQLYCVVGAENEPSRSLFEKAGYKVSGRLRSWLRSGGAYSDAFIYQMMLSFDRVGKQGAVEQ